jgi:hypothetical protein
VNSLDLSGLFNRHILAPLFAKSQPEYNEYFGGTSWSLAERYTQVGKIIFISILYTILTPTALYISCGGFITLFLVDNFLLFRRWSPMPPLDPSMGQRVRQFGLLAISFHMYITSRLVYSWPMDQVSFDATLGLYIAVDKRPPTGIMSLEAKSWHSESQATALDMYRWATIFIFIVTGKLTVGKIGKYGYHLQLIFPLPLIFQDLYFLERPS